MFFKLLKSQVQKSQKKIVKRGEIIYHEGDNPRISTLLKKASWVFFMSLKRGKKLF